MVRKLWWFKNTLTMAMMMRCYTTITADYGEESEQNDRVEGV
jgi:hypothetical protein